LKSENENQASDYIIIGYCEPLVYNIHGYWVVPKVVGCFIMGICDVNGCVQTLVTIGDI
jgi:hypothetical protein